MMDMLRRFAGILMATLREIFDENAYSRFLARQGMAVSRESYALFTAENNTARTKRPRCC